MSDITLAAGDRTVTRIGVVTVWLNFSGRGRGLYKSLGEGPRERRRVEEFRDWAECI